MKNKLAVIIPARNEEKTLKVCLSDLLNIVDKGDIYFVDDASEDKTAKIAGKMLKNVLRTKKNQGKAGAINLAIKKFHLVDKYDYIFPLDADTRPDKDFIKNILATFKADRSGEVAAVIGKIKGLPTTGTSSYRVWEYEISQAVHKKAQSSIGSIIVCSGCSTVYKSRIFKKISFNNDTLTEDMDLTFEIHRKKLGKIIYNPNAFVYTQDPQRLTDLKKQLDRWYGGFWQCVLKHRILFGKQKLDFEVGISAFESIFNGLFILAMILILPFFISKALWAVLAALMLDLVIFTFPTVLFVAIKEKKLSIVKYIPYFYVLRILSSLIFLKSYIVVSLGAGDYLKWKQARRFAFKTA